MSESKTSGSEFKKLHTDSNLKTNTSFEFAQSSHFEFMASHPPMLPHEDEIHELPSNGCFAQVNNNSTISLQPTVSLSAARELIAMMEMVKFFSQQTLQKARWINCKREMAVRLSELVTNTQERIKQGRQLYEKRRQCLEKRRAKVMDFKKRKLRALTQQTEEMEIEIDFMIKGIKPRNASRSFIDRRNEESSIRDAQYTKRKRMYVPMPPPFYHYPQHFPPHYANPVYYQHAVQSQTQNPVFLHPQNKIDPSCRSSLNFNSHKISRESYTIQKEPIIMQHLRQALTLKFKNPKNISEQTENNLDYFDRQIDNPSKSRQQAQRISQTPKSVIRRSSSIKWKRDDREDKQLVEIIENSIKYIKTENSQEKQQNTQAEQLQRMSPIRPIRNNNHSESSSINITYDSEDKRNSKSFEREGDSNDRRRLSSKASDKKSDRGRIQQSSIKIEMIDMSISKNSGSSHSDSSKQHPNRYVPSLAKPFQEIVEEPEEMVSLKATPNDHNLKNSLERQLKNRQKNGKKQDSPKNPRSPLSKQQQQDQILKSIKLDTQSRISRGKFQQNQIFYVQQSGDDILDGITLLKESRASRQKALSLKSSQLQQFICDDYEKEKGSQSQIFAKQSGELDPAQFFDSSLRLSTKSKITKPGRQKSIMIKGGKTQPIKGHLTSIPSADFEQQEEETPPQSNTHIKKNTNS